VKHATGSPENPMSDASLESKFRDLAGEVLNSSQVNKLLSTLWEIEKAPDLQEVTELMRVQ
jgi:2-methylcitrate dehydratase PrpD